MASKLWILVLLGTVALVKGRKLPDRFIGFEEALDPFDVDNDNKTINQAIDEMSYRYPKQFQSLLIILSTVILTLYWIISFFTILIMFLVCYPKNFKEINLKAKEYTETKTRMSASKGGDSTKSKKSTKETSKRSPNK